MSVVYVALPIALLISLAFVACFVWQVRTGQLDDLDTPAMRMLFDDEAAVRPADPEIDVRDPGPGTNATGATEHDFRPPQGKPIRPSQGETENEDS